MMLARLPRAGGGKQNDIHVPGKCADKNSARVLVQVFGNFQANDELEAAAQVNRHTQIPAMKFAWRKQKLVRRYLDTINSDDVRNPAVDGGAQPGARAATHVQDAFRQSERKKFGEGRAR